MSETRTLEQIEEELSKTREALTASVNELAGRLTPASLAEDAKDCAKAKVNKTLNKVKGLVQEAKSGDPRALAILGGAAVVTIGLVTFAFRR